MKFHLETLREALFLAIVEQTKKEEAEKKRLGISGFGSQSAMLASWKSMVDELNAGRNLEFYD